MAKTLSARVIHMHDVDANWNKLPTFIPKQGEVIVYDPDEIENFSEADWNLVEEVINEWCD